MCEDIVTKITTLHNCRPHVWNRPAELFLFVVVVAVIFSVFKRILGPLTIEGEITVRLYDRFSSDPVTLELNKAAEAVLHVVSLAPCMSSVCFNYVKNKL